MRRTMRVDIPESRPRVEVRLDDGSLALLSPLSKEDRHYLVEGLQEMSIESRFSRFGQGRYGLTEGEWDYLTNVDQSRHVAWGAVVDGFGAGVGRYIILDTGDCAEVAMTVLDEYQGRGVGTALFLALVAVARSDGVPALCFDVVPSNNRVLEFLSLANAEVSESGGLVEGRISLDQEIPVEHEAEFVEAMRSFRAG